MNRNILTIATGKQLYVDLAINLARSFFWWHPVSDIRFYIVTDQKKSLPADILDKATIIEIQKGELGEGFSTKLHLDQIAPWGQTLFIDSDCIIFGNLEWVFQQFKGKRVSVIGNYISSGEWFGDISAICKKFNIKHIPKFNGGIYYIEKGDLATKVYSCARELEKRYDEIGFVRLRNRPNDEVIMAVAMELNEQEVIIDNGTFLSDPQACPGPYRLNVIKGQTSMLNPAAPNPLHREWYPFEKVSPVVVHFLGSYTQHYSYRKEVFRLKRATDKKLTILSELQALITIEWPERIQIFFKNTFRPFYHRIFGIRKLKISERI